MMIVLYKTLSGKLAAIFSLAFLILFVMKVWDLIPLPTFAIFPLGIVGLVSGIMSFIKKDRSISVFLSLLIGLLAIIWISAELLLPH